MKRQKLEIGERGEEPNKVLAATGKKQPQSPIGSGPRKGGARSKEWVATTGNARRQKGGPAQYSPVWSLALMSAGRGQEEEEGPAPDDHPTGFVEHQEWRKRSETCLAKPGTLQAASQPGPQTLGVRHLGKIGRKHVNPAFQL